MRINIIGYGTVGKAQESLLRKLGHEVFVFDPYVFPDIKSPEKRVDLTFVCTPGNVVPDAVNNLIEQGVEGLYVIKSTTSIGAAKGLMDSCGVHILNNPEFLREQCAYEDVMNPDRIMIGQCCSEHAQKLVTLYAPLKKPIYVTSLTESEAAKLLSNAYLSVLITFWNEADELSKKLGLTTSEVARLVCADSRMSTYGASKFGHPFGGRCLPMCMDELISAFRGEGLNPLLFEAVKTYNLRIQNKHDNT